MIKHDEKKKLQTMSLSDLQSQLMSLRVELAQSRLNIVMHKQADTSLSKKIKYQIALIKNLMSQHQSTLAEGK